MATLRTSASPDVRCSFLAAPLQVIKGSKLTAKLRHESGFGDHNIGRFRLSITSQDPSLVKLDGGSALPDAIGKLLAIDPATRPSADRITLEKYFRDAAGNPVSRAQAALDAARKTRMEYEQSIPSTMVMKERPQPREAFVLTRGEDDHPVAKVERALPAILPPLPANAPVNRLGLARWLVSGDHPLTARVWINRSWERFFGTGIVKTSENFGSQAEWPYHPELLDWLAVEFASPTVLPTVNGQPASAWDMKAIQKFIVTSQAYRQAPSRRRP